jgi:hypothetical protein
MKYKIFFVTTALFLFTLLAVYWIHITFFKVNVVFYAALTDGVIATSLTFMFAVVSKKFRSYILFEKLLAVFIWLLLGYIFAISVPTVLDRSLSFYTLEKLQQRGGGIKYSAFESVYADEYIKEHRLVDVRLTEQIMSGTIALNDGCVTLTSRGEMLVRFSRFFRAHFLPKQRLLMNEYSDDLVDPFRTSTSKAEYKC